MLMAQVFSQFDHIINNIICVRVIAECREDVLEQKERKRLTKELQEGILYTVFNCIYLPRKWRLSRRNFLSTIYESQWDKLHIFDNTSFRDKVSTQFKKVPRNTRVRLPPSGTSKDVCAKISRVSPPLPPKLSPEALKKAKDKFKEKAFLSAKKSFAQVTKGYNTNLLKLHEAFSALPANKIIEMNNISTGKTNPKPKIQITTKGPSRKSILIPMDTNNKAKIVTLA